MLKKVLLLLATLLLAASTALAAAKVEQNAAPNLPVGTVVATEIQMVQEMFAGFDSLNYEKFSQNFSEDFKKVFTPEVFKSAHKDTIEKMGEFLGMEILMWQAHADSKTDSILYRGKFAKDEDMLITVTLDRKNPSAVKLTHVLFDSPLMQ